MFRIKRGKERAEKNMLFSSGVEKERRNRCRYQRSPGKRGQIKAYIKRRRGRGVNEIYIERRTETEGV
jgi:hypothetical protein